MHAITDTDGSVRLLLAPHEVEPLKDLVTSFLEHYGVDCAEGVYAEPDERQKLLADYAAVLLTKNHEDDEACAIRDKLCFIEMEKVGLKFQNELGEGGTGYALEPLYDRED